MKILYMYFIVITLWIPVNHSATEHDQVSSHLKLPFINVLAVPKSSISMNSLNVFYLFRKNPHRSALLIILSTSNNFVIATDVMTTATAHNILIVFIYTTPFIFVAAVCTIGPIYKNKIVLQSI